MAPLTNKENEICELVSIGLSNKEIADRLGISRRTVEFHRLKAYRKLGVHNSVQLARIMIKHEGSGHV